MSKKADTRGMTNGMANEDLGRNGRIHLLLLVVANESREAFQQTVPFHPGNET